MNSIKTNKRKTYNVKETVQNLCTILANIKKLKNSNIEDNKTLLKETEEILPHLEQSLPKLTKLLQKRKLQRQKKRTKRLELKKAINNKFSSIEPKTSDNASNTEQINKITPKLKPHVQLRKQYDAREYLQKFDLIIKLHQARAKNSQLTAYFAKQFENLIAIWSGIETQHKTPTIEQQWHEVLYGAAKPQNVETTKLTFKTFRHIRHTWNSFATRNSKIASQLQDGPVLPPEQPNSLWISYCLQN